MPQAAAEDEIDLRALDLAPVRPSSPAWRTRVLGVVRVLARSQKEMTSDDVWRRLVDLRLGEVEPRLLGPVLCDAQRLGWIKKTDRVRPSVRRACHRRPVAVWSSLIFRRPSRAVRPSRTPPQKRPRKVST